VESSKRIVDRFARCLGQDHVVTLEPVDEFAALADLESGSHRLRHRGLGLAGDFARDQFAFNPCPQDGHDGRIFLTGIKSFWYPSECS